MTTTGTIDIRPAGERFHTRFGWLDSWHSFSFGQHHDPTNTGHGLLIVSNDDTVTPNAGFTTHGHRDMEIVTWVLEGALEHRDSAGHEGIIRPGLAQRMSAGTGIMHSEMNASRDEPVHLVQMWVVPDTRGVEPGYEQLDVSDDLAGGGWVAVASGRHDAAISIHQRGATLWAARPLAGSTLTLPDAPFVHVFVARGDVHLGDRMLVAGDAARLTGAGPRPVDVDLDAELLVWASDVSVRR